MAIVDMVKWDPEDKPLYAIRYPESNLSTFTQLVVAESQEAVLFSKGRMMGKFGPGKHTLNTENLPLLRDLFGIPFGGKNPFTAEIWFVNKVMPLNIDWATDVIRIFDAEYKAMVPLRAKGRYGLRVADAERFLVKLVGTIREYSAAMLTDNFQGALVSKTKSVLSQAMQAQSIGVNSISAYLDPLSTTLKQSMLPFWEDYGFELIGFYITSIDVDELSPEGQQIVKAMADQSAQNIAGHTWQQQRSFDVAQKALTEGKDIGVMGALLMTGGLLGGSGSGLGQELMRPAPSNVPAPVAPSGTAQAGVVRQVFCSNCSKKFPSTAKFCPHCGDPYTPCPKCGADNAKDAARCVTCGTRLPPEGGGPSVNEQCGGCGSPLEPNAKFCPACGRKVG